MGLDAQMRQRKLPTVARSTVAKRLLDTAGSYFAEHGFEAATGKEICLRAGVNPAAVNYYFGGMQDLYEAALQEASLQLSSEADFSKALSQHSEPEMRLRAYLEVAIRPMLENSWAMKLLMRETLAPSSTSGQKYTNKMSARIGILRSIVADLLELPMDDPKVAYASINVYAPCQFLLLVDRSVLKRAYPGASQNRSETEELADYMTQFMLGGLSAIRKALRPSRTRSSAH